MQIEKITQINNFFTNVMFDTYINNYKNTHLFHFLKNVYSGRIEIEKYKHVNNYFIVQK